MLIWSNSFLDQLKEDAGNQISTDINCIFNRSCFATTSGLSVYTLPQNLRQLLRITWRGLRVDPLNWDEFVSLTPNTAFATEADSVEVSISRPRFYTTHPTNLYDIRFYPTPNETFTGIGDAFSPDNGPKCILAYYQKVDDSSELTSLPAYIDRRTRKAYVLWKAFMAEGAGQNLRASVYYRNKYYYLISQFRRINDGCYLSRRPSLQPDYSALTGGQYRMPKPTLGPNFERTEY